MSLIPATLAIGLALVTTASPLPAPRGHEASSGVGVVGGGYVTATAVWVTPGLAVHPYYRQWVPDLETRTAHRRAAASYTVVLVEVANRSILHVAGYLSLNIRLLTDGTSLHPLEDGALRQAFPQLIPEKTLQRLPPGHTFLKAYAFPSAAGAARVAAILIRPLWVFDARRQVGELPPFELRFRPGQLAFPP